MSSQKKVGLFVTCLVDMRPPSIASSTIHLLKKYGFAVTITTDMHGSKELLIILTS